jgi:transglutaminase-like putative cysteine protease
MKLRRAFDTSIFALALIGIASLSLAESNPVIAPIAALLAVLAYHRTLNRARPLGPGGSLFAVLACVALAPVDLFLVTGDWAVTLAHLLVAIQIVKLFGRKRARDYAQIIIVSLIHLGVSAVMTVHLVFSVVFLIYLAVATWTLIMFLLVRELERRAPDELEEITVGRGAVSALFSVTCATLALTAVLFAVFPRFSAVLFNIPPQPRANVSGFSDSISLSDLSSIQKVAENVMRVQVEERPDWLPQSPRWRGLAYDFYHGGRWERGPWITRIDPREPGRMRAPNRTRERKSWTIHQSGESLLRERGSATMAITLSPTGTDVLFGVPTAESVEFLSALAPASVGKDGAGAIYGAQLPPNDVRYRIRSYPRAETALASEARAAYTAVPEEISDDLRRLATEVAQRAGASTPRQEAEALEAHLLSGEYEYTLTEIGAGNEEGRDPILHFLLSSKRGHCELYASSLVLMARTRGIPARVVTGFQTGEWNPYGGFYQVRQSDAHAWVEVFVEGHWRELDPTPGGEEEEEGGVFASLRQISDYVQLRWMNYVISYSLSDQVGFVEKQRKRAQKLRKRVTAWFLRLKDHALASTENVTWLLVVAGATLIGLILGVVLLRRYLRRRRVQGAGGRRVVPLTPIEFYERLTLLLKRLGHERSASETPLEFAHRLAALGQPELAPVTTVVEAFYAVRFGEQALPAEREEAVRRALTNIEALAQPPGRH